MILYLQDSMDYESLSKTVIEKKQADLLFQLYYRRDFKTRNQQRAITEAFIECLRQDELAIALKFWNNFEMTLSLEKSRQKVF